MNTDSRVKHLVMAVAGTLAVFAVLTYFAKPAHAEQPDCVGDRHLDDCGQNCVACPGPVECPPTTECPSCPLPAPCPTVTCKDGDDGAPGTTVVVDRCPEAPMYVPCNVHKKYKKGDVLIDGQWAHCARAGAPHRVFFPKTAYGY